MAICVQHHAKVIKQSMLLDGIDVGPPKCEHGFNGSIHEGINDISNVKVHLKTHSGNVNIKVWMPYVQFKVSDLLRLNTGSSFISMT